MLGDIARVSLAVGTALFPNPPWTDFGVSVQAGAAPKSPMEQLGFIEHLLPILAHAVTQIEQSPLTAAATQGRAVLPVHARRVTASAWMSHAGQGQARRAVTETVTLLTYDTPENRAVRSFLGALERDSRVFTRMAEAEDEPEAAARAARCLRRLRGLRCADWWKGVTLKPGDWTLPPTGREAMRAGYARVALERKRYRQGFGFEWDQPLLTLPPREGWRLYEVWCLLSVLEALRETGWEVTAAQELFAVRAGRLTLTLAVGAASKITLHSLSGQTLTLTYNRTFAERRESLTHAMQPDITLSSGARIWVLDAKFKPYCEPGEEGGDINQMHAYHDAIVGTDGTRAAAAAWCLYAGLTGAENRSHITYGRSVGTPVGALCLRPGDRGTQANLRGLLARWLMQG